MNKNPDEHCSGCPRFGESCNLDECVLDDLGTVRYLLSWMPAGPRDPETLPPAVSREKGGGPAA